MNLRTILLLTTIVGLSINWAVVDNLASGVQNLRDNVLPQDINLIPEWVKDAFNSWKTNYNKDYSPTEYIHRLGVFFVNLRKIQFNNNEETRGYSLGETEFMDLEKTEFAQTMLMRGTMQKRPDAIAEQQESQTSEEVFLQMQLRQNRRGSTPPPQADQRSRTVAPVKKQGQCGACWAFATVAALEGHHVLSGNPLTTFSQQYLVDCCPEANYFCTGCNGAWPADALSYVRDHGIALEASYRPYNGIKQPCAQLLGGALSYRINGWKYVPPRVNDLKIAVARQPIAAVIDATDWQLYRSGIYDGCRDTQKDQINHAVTIVGYTADAWIVKNSWGTKWGEDGYIRLNMGNECGILYEAVYPVL